MARFFLILAVAFGMASGSALARECVRLGFSVNDYGKDGPTRDAQALLDRHIEKVMTEKNITGYATGTKSVDCKLFLDFIVFDEHTCTAAADVCWGKGPITKKLSIDDFKAKSPLPVKATGTKTPKTPSLAGAAAPKPQ